MNKNIYYKLINFGLAINLGIYLYSLSKGFNRPFWIDEIHVIGISKDIFDRSLTEVFGEQLLPPLYFYLVGLINYTTDLKSSIYEDHFYYLRIVNILGFIPLIYGFKILKEKFKEINLSFVFLLLLSSNIFFYYSIELKMYFIIFCLSFLIHSIFLVDEEQNKYKLIFFVSSILLTLCHVFGLTIAMSIIMIQSINNFYYKKYKKLYFNFFSGISLIVLFAIMFYYATVDPSNLQGFKWVKFQKWYFRVFLEWTLPTVIIILIMAFFILINEKLKKIFSFNKNAEINLKTFKILIPSLILVIVTGLISLKHPIITHRNLIVTFPAGIIFAGLLSIKYLKYKNQNFILILFLVTISYINLKHYSKNVIFAGENIRWVVEKSFNKNCENVPIYFGDDGKSKEWRVMVEYSVDLYADYFRPIKEITKLNINDLKENILDNKNCDIHLANFHNRNFEKKINDLNNSELKFQLLYAPNTLRKNFSKSGVVAVLIN